MKKKIICLLSITILIISYFKKVEEKKIDTENIINVNITNLSNVFIDKKADAVSIWSPYTKDIFSKISNEDFSDEITFLSSFMTTKKYIEKFHDIVKRFSKSVLKAMDCRKNNIDETVISVSELTENNIGLVKSEIDTGEWFTSEYLKKASENGNILKWYEAQQKVFLNSKVIKESVPVTNYLELEMLKKNVL